MEDKCEPEMNLCLVVCIFRLMDAGRLFYTDSANAMKRDHMVAVLKSFTQVRAGVSVMCYQNTF